jgi:hypothetical protein
VSDIPESTSIRMRPVWHRRQRRRWTNDPLPPPTQDEVRDAIQVLALPDAMLETMPAIWQEATRVLDEASDPA